MSELPSDKLSPVKKTLLAIRTLRARIREQEERSGEPIAIVGMAARFPGAEDIHEFWNLLREGRDAVGTMDDDRWSSGRVEGLSGQESATLRLGGFLKQVDRFDASFFRISAVEAELMDPQQRLALEVSWEALENAGMGGSQPVRTGTFLGMGNADYQRMTLADPSRIDAFTGTGAVLSAAAGRIAYTMGWEGMAIVVDTACSSSLVALHLAARSLQSRECDLAVAGGVNLVLSPEAGVALARGGMLSLSGHCKAFDTEADGYVRGEGCGMVVLKRLTDAQNDGDRILAVFRGSAVNQDGRSGGLTIPNGPAQERLIRSALAAAKVEPNEISYVEAHGTGTPLGDPIEAHALAGVFGSGRREPLVIGSAKTNIGHLEAAAGIAGVIKVILSMQHDWIPAHLHWHAINPHIDWHEMPLTIPAHGQQWPRGNAPRLAGVSSFGFSGTNAHVILEEAPTLIVPGSTPRTSHVLAISAKNAIALDAMAAAYQKSLQNQDAASVCFTVGAGRTHFEERIAVVGRNAGELREKLAAGPVKRGSGRGNPPTIAFLFTGQGSQRAGMGRDLYEHEPVFRAAIDAYSQHLRSHWSEPLEEVLWGGKTALLQETEYAQAALFAIECALAELWKSWGVQPNYVLGHSVGEYTAACVAGHFRMEDALTLMVERGRQMQAMGPGWTMIAARCSVTDAETVVRGTISIAAINGPDRVTLAGERRDLERAVAELESGKIEVKWLAVQQGFHSQQMESMADGFSALASRLANGTPSIPLVSSVHGRRITAGELSEPGYWRRQIRDSVVFADALEELVKQGCDVFVEIGPSPILIGLGQEWLSDASRRWTCSMRSERSESEQMTEATADLYAAGANLNWRGMYPHRMPVADLPTYPFQRERFWFSAGPSAEPSADPQEIWTHVVESGRWQAGQCRLDLAVGSYPQRWEILSKLTLGYIVNTFCALGAFADSRYWTIQALLDNCGIQSSYRRLIPRWLNKLAAAGLIEQHGTQYRALQRLSVWPIEPLHREANAIFAADRTFLDFVNKCGLELPEILTGRKSALETLFPGDSFQTAEDLYERAPLSVYFSAIVRAAAAALVREDNATLHILEIGAGIGATTSAIAPIFPQDRTAYYFTDLSDLFLNHSRDKFAAYPNMRFALFDIDRPAVHQLPHATWDVIVATNVLHATPDLRKTVSNAYSLLNPGGILILCEATEYLDWFDITTGLIEGWQSFADDLRHEHPLLSSYQWQQLLRDNGFENIAALPEPGSPAETLKQHVFLAQKAGRRARSNHSFETSRKESARGNAPDVQSHRSRLEAAPESETLELLVEAIRHSLAGVLRVPADSLEEAKRLVEFGLDSLMAVEFRNRLSRALELDSNLPAPILYEFPTIEALAKHLGRELFHLDATADRASELAQMSEEDAEALLLKKLEALQRQ
jgi:acyl transferase domain-containing protein/SAM-dependent methyltransferase/aryl carrier-like protein